MHLLYQIEYSTYINLCQNGNHNDASVSSIQTLIKQHTLGHFPGKPGVTPDFPSPFVLKLCFLLGHTPMTSNNNKVSKMKQKSSACETSSAQLHHESKMKTLHSCLNVCQILSYFQNSVTGTLGSKFATHRSLI